MEELFSGALFAAAGELQVLAFEVGIDRTYEADLRAALRRAVQMGAGALDVGLRVEPEVDTQLADWPGVGKADLGVRGAADDGYRALAELKWCRDDGQIEECLWDLAKMALARRVAGADTALLAVGGPARLWEPGRRCAELFGAGSWDTRDLLAARYESSWRYCLKGSRARPTRLPARIDTNPLNAVPIHLPGADWLLQLLAVDAPGGEWLTMDPDGWPAKPAETPDPAAEALAQSAEPTTR